MLIEMSAIVMRRRASMLGLFFIALGIVFLMIGGFGAFYPMATIEFGPIKASGLSPFTVSMIFIGIVLILIGIVLTTGVFLF